MAQKSAKGEKSAIAKKVIVKVKKVKKVKIIKKKVVASKEKIIVPAVKLKPVIVAREFRMNIRCRRCFFVDGYTAGEKVCHNCKEEIYAIDKI